MHTRLLPLRTALLCLLATTVAHAQDREEAFQPLWNGQDLAGWVRVNTAPSTWTVMDGMLVCSGKPTGELRTQRMYQNFILELEWRHLVPKGNAGVFVWADDITAPGVPFHRGIEVQVLENDYGNTDSHTTHGDIFPIHGARMTPLNGRGGSRAFPTENRSLPSPQWNHYRITCVDGDISLAVNGKIVTRGKGCSPRKGYICLESEGGVVHYRNIRIQELPATPVADEDVATADRGFRCLYSGVDLAGWQPGGGDSSRWRTNDWILAFNERSVTGDDTLATTDEFGDMGFICDVRLHEASGNARILLRDAAASAIELSAGSSALAGHVKTPGEWNRFEGVLRGDRLTLWLNGQELCRERVLTGIPGRGAVRLVPDGPIEFANLYVRELPAP